MAIYGLCLYEPQVRNIFGLLDSNYEAVETALKKLIKPYPNLELVIDKNIYYLGRVWGDIGDDETGKEFRGSVEEPLKKIFDHHKKDFIPKFATWDQSAQ